MYYRNSPLNNRPCQRRMTQQTQAQNTQRCGCNQQQTQTTQGCGCNQQTQTTQGCGCNQQQTQNTQGCGCNQQAETTQGCGCNQQQTQNTQGCGYGQGNDVETAVTVITTCHGTETTCGCNNNGTTQCVSADSFLLSEEFQIQGCNDHVCYNAGVLPLSGQGRLINTSVTLRRVCPGKKIALGVTLVELDRCNRCHNRAFKAYEVTVPSGSGCISNLQVRDIFFVVPETSSLNGGTATMCGTRRFKILATANYLDTNVCM